MSRLFIVEAVLTIGVVVAALVAPLSASCGFRRVWYLFGCVARRQALSAIGIGFLALAIRAAMLPILPVPQPRIGDEFSYLLAADTFASGRVTNSPHPMWIYFESFHINHQPTYSSIYPPAQGLVLAAGRAFAGHPWAGVLVSVSLMCTALCWMLQGWLPARWALLGALVAVIRIATFSYWVNSYWGGAISALGGALVLGALPRLLRRTPRWGDIFALVFGVIILANSRPYEGLVLCVSLAIALASTNFKRRLFFAKSIGKKSMPVLFVLFMTAALMMGFYFWRVTGNPLRMPYQINRETYWMAQAFLWQSPRPGVQYRHEEMRGFYETWLQAQVRQRSSFRGFLDGVARKFGITWLFYLGPLLSLSLIGFTRAALDRRIRLLLVTGGMSMLALMAESWFFPHYVAPFTGLIYALWLQSLRHVRFWRWRGKSTGLSLVLAIPIVSMALFVLAVITLPAIPVQGKSFRSWCCAQTGPSERSRLLADLAARGGRHLVITRYGPDHDLHSEWVYNEADIDNAQVVFARDMGSIKNIPLIQYFKDRKVWLLEPDKKPLSLVPYY